MEPEKSVQESYSSLRHDSKKNTKFLIFAYQSTKDRLERSFFMGFNYVNQ